MLILMCCVLQTRVKEKNILIDVFDDSMETKKCEQENKENKFFTLASPLDSAKKSTKVRIHLHVKSKQCLRFDKINLCVRSFLQTRGKEKLLAPADVFDDSMESK